MGCLCDEDGLSVSDTLALANLRHTETEAGFHGEQVGTTHLVVYWSVSNVHVLSRERAVFEQWSKAAIP